MQVYASSKGQSQIDTCNGLWSFFFLPLEVWRVQGSLCSPIYPSQSSWRRGGTWSVSLQCQADSQGGEQGSLLRTIGHEEIIYTSQLYNLKFLRLKNFMDFIGQAWPWKHQQKFVFADFGKIMKISGYTVASKFYMYTIYTCSLRLHHASFHPSS